MPFLLLLLLTLVHLQQKWPDFSWHGSTSILITFLGLGAMLGWNEWLVRGFGRLLRQEPDQRQPILRQFNRQRRWQGWALLLFFLAALYFLGWGWTASTLLQSSTIFLPGVELVLLSPLLITLVLSWARFFDVERLAQQLSALPDDPPFMSRWAYLTLQIRYNLLLVIPPLALLLIQQTMLAMFPALQEQANLAPLYATVLLGLAFLFIPILLRVFLGLRSMPDCPLRQRLLATARRLGLRCNDILIWDTRYTTANAMITGFVPVLRYVVLTDRLIRDLTEEEIEAVFGHEAGHVKHRHMLFYLGFLLASLVVVGGLWKMVETELNRPHVQAFFLENLPFLYDWLYTHQILIVWSLMLLVAVYIFVVFGFISRRCERQADIFGCRTVSVPVFIMALEKVAALNGIPRQRPGWLASWQHSTIAKRVAFLERLHREPALEQHFQVRLGLIKWGMVLGLAACLAGMLAIVGTDLWEGLLGLP